ncbi:MAG TPA: DUF6122 family protein [Cytophagaceae bacterium]
MTFSEFHLILHFVLPVLVAYLFFRKEWKVAAIIMVLMNIVDVDHLLATPIFDPNRCSIGFHPLHSYYAIAVYAVLALYPVTRYAGIGLLLHMGLDYADCYL